MYSNDEVHRVLVLKRGYSKSQIKKLLRKRIRKFNRVKLRSPKGSKKYETCRKSVTDLQKFINNWENLFNRRDSTLWEQVRQEAFERDNYTCLKCGSRVKLEGHHIRNFADNIEERYDVNNVATLCNRCHNEFHRLFGTRRTSKRKLNLFLKLEN